MGVGWRTPHYQRQLFSSSLAGYGGLVHGSEARDLFLFLKDDETRNVQRKNCEDGFVGWREVLGDGMRGRLGTVFNGLLHVAG